MYVNRAWIPLEDAFDREVVERLLTAGVRFVRGLRYNLAASRPLACAVLPDSRPTPTALYIVRPTSGETYETALAELIADSPLASWVWRAGDGAMPSLPPDPCAEGAVR
jgi:hypothetical protein